MWAEVHNPSKLAEDMASKEVIHVNLHDCSQVVKLSTLSNHLSALGTSPIQGQNRERGRSRVGGISMDSEQCAHPRQRGADKGKRV